MRYFLFLVLILGACKEEPYDIAESLTEHQSYFYNELGLERIYKVDSIQFDFNSVTQRPERDTASYFLRETTIGIYTTQDGQEWLEIQVDRRNSQTEYWYTTNFVRERIESYRGLRYEDGLIFIKMEYPVSQYGTWDGNALFNTPHILYIKGETIEEYKEWNYEYLDLDETYEIDGEIINDVVRIQQKEDDISNLFHDESYELYAKDFGIVSKVRKYLLSECQRTGETTEFCVNNPTELHADRGYIYKQDLIEINRPN